jgi:outer membrane protein assembly factor BamD (BamD/ComL family)
MQRDLLEAKKAVSSSEYTRAIPILTSLVKEDRKLPMQAEAAKLLQDVETEASTRLEQTRKMYESGNTKEALGDLRDLIRRYAGTRAAKEGAVVLESLIISSQTAPASSREQQAKQLLDQAREEHRNKQYLSCLDRCEYLVLQYSDLAQGREASQLAAKIKDDAECMRQVCEGLSDRLCTLYLSMAETWLKNGKPQQAVHYLERVVQGFPNTRQAEIAQVRLSQIQGPPALKVEYKNP